MSTAEPPEDVGTGRTGERSGGRRAATRRGVGKGEPWGGGASQPADVEIEGGDADLARCVRSGEEVSLVAYDPSPDADLARAVGLTPGSPQISELTIDALEVGLGTDTPVVAVNAVVFGVAPDRLTRWTRRRELAVTIDGRPAWKGGATAVVVANGQFLRGLDIVPRGHPGDGRVEIQVYALAPGKRAGMRRRLPTGTHVPHPHITERSGRVVDIVASSAMPIEIDGQPCEPARALHVAVLPGAVRILV